MRVAGDVFLHKIQRCKLRCLQGPDRGRKGTSLSLGRASGAGGSAAGTEDVEIANRKEIVNKAPDPHPLLPHVLVVGSNDFILSLGEPNRGDRKTGWRG